MSGVLQRSCLVVASAVAISACARPTTPSAVDGVIPGQQDVFVCGRWSPHDPGAGVALLDFLTLGEAPGGGPTDAAVGAITGAGGQIIYEFHVPMVRALVDLPRVPSLLGGLYNPSTVLAAARTVNDQYRFDASLIVMLTHPVSEEDIRSVQALGATVTNIFRGFAGYAVTIPDAAIPALRALARVKRLELNGYGCPA
jgi:hypothetical protein